MTRAAKPRLLDLFCGAGGAAMGYHRAGFEVVGVDIDPQPRYPFEFHQADVMIMLEFEAEWMQESFDAIHASPPCQDYSRRMRHLAAEQPRLVEPVRELLRAIGLPYVIENVDGAPLARASTLTGEHGVELCGTMFGRRIWRHRLFETNFPITMDRGCDHREPPLNPHDKDSRRRIIAEFGSDDPERPWREEMGVGWMRREEAREAIPPRYTQWIGERMLEHIRSEVEA